jgi:hypothetical protein
VDDSWGKDFDPFSMNRAWSMSQRNDVQPKIYQTLVDNCAPKHPHVLESVQLLFGLIFGRVDFREMLNVVSFGLEHQNEASSHFSSN